MRATAAAAVGRKGGKAGRGGGGVGGINWGGDAHKYHHFTKAQVKSARDGSNKLDKSGNIFHKSPIKAYQIKTILHKS